MKIIFSDKSIRMLSLFGFGKKRRTRRKVSRKGRKSSKMSKPPSRLLKICKKYRVKATMKRGSKRVYKSIAVLKKACIKKVRMAMKKDARRVKKMAFGAPARRRKCGMAFGARRRRSASAFGKRGRRSGRKVSKAAAMKAFRQFYKRHCAGRGSRFGNGGNPALSASMGYQFCPSGMGGVLGANSTGMFPTPCTSLSTSQAMAEAAVALPTYSSFGRKRGRKSTRRTKRKGRKSTRRTKRRSTRKGRKSTRRTKRKGRKSTRRTKRKSTRKGRKVVRRRRGVTMRRRRRNVMFGLRRRRV